MLQTNLYPLPLNFGTHKNVCNIDINVQWSLGDESSVSEILVLYDAIILYI